MFYVKDVKDVQLADTNKEMLNIFAEKLASKEELIFENE